MEEQKYLKISIKLSGGKNSIIPAGLIENLTILIIDEKASFHFEHSNITKLLSQRQKKDGFDSKYVERLQKTLVNYPGKTKEQILKLIKENLEELGVKKI